MCEIIVNPDIGDHSDFCLLCLDPLVYLLSMIF